MNALHFLFDFDGTLADSATLHESAFREMLALTTGERSPNLNYSAIKGLSTREACLRLGIKQEIILEACIAKKQSLYRSAVRSGQLSLFPGARRLLLTVLELGGDNYLVTSGSRASIDCALEQLNLRKLFAGLITSDDADVGKPDPDPYRICLNNFQLTAGDSIAIEDAQPGVLSARAAGLRVIGVHDSTTRKHADFYFPTLSALNDALRHGSKLLPPST